jgi:hypothetical protein
LPLARRARLPRVWSPITQVSDLADRATAGHLTNAAQVLLLKQRAETIDAATVRFRLTPDERQLLLEPTRARDCC